MVSCAGAGLTKQFSSHRWEPKLCSQDGNGQLDFDEFTDYITGAASMPITSRLLQEEKY